MTSLRERARLIRESGEEDRGNFQPEAGSAPLKVYQYWARHAHNVPARENFCHYWRVVAIWAPLMFIRKKLIEPVASAKATPFVLVAMYLLVGVVLLFLGGAWIAGALMLGIPYVAAGFAVALYLVFSVPYAQSDWQDKTAFWGTIPVSGVVYGTLRGGQAVGRVWTKTATAVLLYTVFGLLGVLMVVSVVAAIVQDWAGWGKFFLTLGIIVGVIVAFCFLIAGVSFLGDYFKRKKKLAQHEMDRLYYEDRDEWRRRNDAAQGPGAFARFMINVGDFFNLIFQVVRTKKWKICPTVEIPNE